MDDINTKTRNIEKRVKFLLEHFPVVIILGVRQCGKSTLAKKLCPAWKYLDLDNPNDFERITSDPMLFFEEYPSHLIIDEAQKSKILFEVLRSVVDKKRNIKGRFLLTGSASFELMNHISESLAGRVGLIELSPFKMNEISGTELSPFFKIFSEKINHQNTKMIIDEFRNLSLEMRLPFSLVKNFFLRGGYPEPTLSYNDNFRLEWLQFYFETYINRDIRTFYPKLDLIKYRRVLYMLSQLSGTIINKSEVARSVECNETTVRDYLDIIEGAYFWRTLPSYRSPKVKTTLKLGKGYFRDSGMAFYLQKVFTPSDLENFHGLGRLFECFVIEEIIRGIGATNARGLQYFHYRTKGGVEVDFIVEGSFGLLPIEIKYGTKTSMKNISSLQTFLEQENLPLGLVINNGEEISLLSHNILQIPVGFL